MVTSFTSDIGITVDLIAVTAGARWCHSRSGFSHVKNSALKMFSAS